MTVAAAKHIAVGLSPVNRAAITAAVATELASDADKLAGVVLRDHGGGAYARAIAVGIRRMRKWMERQQEGGAM